MSLRSDILEWDGKSKSDISTIYARHTDRAGMLKELIEYLDDPSVQKGATWLLKRYIEDNGPLNTQPIKDILGKASVRARVRKVTSVGF